MELLVKVLSASFLVSKIGYLGIALTEPISWTLMTTILAIGYIVILRHEDKVIRQDK